MRKEIKRLITLFFCVITALSLVFSAVSCGDTGNTESNGASAGESLSGEEPGQVEIVKKDWKSTGEGYWEIEDNIFVQTKKVTGGRLLNLSPVEQDYITISAEVKLASAESSAGFEFRAKKTFDASDSSVTSFTVNGKGNALTKFPDGSDRYGKGSKPAGVETGKWVKLELILNGTNAAYYVDNKLVDERSDCAIKAGNKYFALLAGGAGTLVKNVKIETYEPNNLSWDELLDKSDLEKSGYDRFSATHFEYPYVGFGKTSLLVSPYGFMTPNAKRPSYIGSNYRDTPQFIYDLWWDDTIKVDPFTFTGGYEVNGSFEEGEMLNDGVCSYKQVVDIDSGVLTTDLNLLVGGEYIKTVRELVVNEDGVVAYRIVNGGNKPFVFRLTARDSVFGRFEYTVKEDGFLAKCNLRKDTENHAYVRVKATSEAGFAVRNDGTLVFEPTDKPLYIYLAPESDLTFEEEHNPIVNAENIAETASLAGFDATVAAAKKWYKNYYSTGRVSIPDLGMAKWYVRSLYYHAVSMAGTRVPPGCYSNNVAGFFGGPCPEFDLSLSQYMLMMTNHTGLAQTTVDWYANTRETLRANAESGYTDKTGHSHEAVSGGYLIPWIAGWDGSPTRGEEVGHEQGWVSSFAGANAASFILNQAEYLAEDLSLAKDIMLGQLRMMMSFFKKIDGKWLHEGVWAGGNNYASGSFSESMAAVYSIVTISAMREKSPGLFTESENAEIDEWLKRLPDMPPYNDRFTVTYDPDKAMYTIGHTTSDVPEMITEGTGYVGGPTNNVYFWYHLLPYNDPYLAGTLVSIAESGQFDYHFNTGWSATVAARAGLSDFAFDYARYMLRSSSLYDDWYFTENVNDSEDFKRSPELGSHGSYVMAVSAMMFDGETGEYVKAFPALPRRWQAIGADFTKMLAKGNLEVSGAYTNDETTVTVTNRSSENATRDIFVRVKEGSGMAVCNGKEYAITDGCMAVIAGVEIPAGKTVTITAKGIEKEVVADDFSVLSPVAGSDRVRTKNVPFSWESSSNAASYRLVISKYSDLSTPIFDKNVGLTTLYYPLDETERINLDEGTRYYWTVYAVHGANETQATQGICSFKTKGGGAEPVNPLPEGSKLDAFGKTWDINQYAVTTKDGVSVTSIMGYQENNPSCVYFVTDKDFTITVTVKTGELGKAGIEMLCNGSYQFVRTEDGKISSYGSLAAGGTSAAADATEKVTYRMSRSNGVISTYYKLDGESDFTKIMEGELPSALNGQEVKICLFAISSYYDQGTQIAAEFTDYSEEFFEPTLPDEPGDDIPEGEAIGKGEKVTAGGIEFIASDGAKIAKAADGSVSSLIVGGIDGRNDADPTGFYITVKQNFAFTARFRTKDLGKSGLLLQAPDGKYMFIRSEGGVVSSYGSMQAGCGSANAGNIDGFIYFRLALENGVIHTAFSTDGETFVKVVNDVKLSYDGETEFKLWLFASQEEGGAKLNAAEFVEPKLVTSQYVAPETGITAGQTVEAFGLNFTAASDIKKTDDGIEICGAGKPDNDPAGMYISLSGDFTLEAKLDISLNGATAGITMINANGNYMFIRSNPSYLLESYGNLNTGASGVGGTAVGYNGGEITVKIVRSGNTVTTYYKIGDGEFVKFSGLEIEEGFAAESGTLKLYFAVNGGGADTRMTVKNVSVTAA